MRQCFKTLLSMKMLCKKMKHQEKQLTGTLK